ncbi:MAG: hypothetical protein HC837_06100 [Chloroflexaceae bacterium]|nr:hypothetical protein [Chloroflexaceae bacterium]
MHTPTNPQAHQYDALDAVLREELCWEVPADLTQRLLTMVPAVESKATTSVAAAHCPRRPQPWYTALVMLLTIATVTLSLMIGWQLAQFVSVSLGLVEFWHGLQQAPAAALAWFYEQLPGSRTVIEFALSLQDQLYWLLVAVVIWLTLDGLPNRRQVQQQAS